VSTLERSGECSRAELHRTAPAATQPSRLKLTITDYDSASCEKLLFATRVESQRHSLSAHRRRANRYVSCTPRVERCGSDGAEADSDVGKDLFWVFPSVGTVPPGEEWRLQVAVFVDESWAPRLTLGEEMNGEYEGKTMVSPPWKEAQRRCDEADWDNRRSRAPGHGRERHCE
jgi:hypothetical protein